MIAPHSLQPSPPHSRSGPCGRFSLAASKGWSTSTAAACTRPTPAQALVMARDVYTRRQEGVSIWVVPSKAITASSPDDKGPAV
jgi:ring-1,2-phenylacetyl-CoA epoxidase subunit PaaB